MTLDLKESYIVIAIIVLLIIALLTFITGSKRNRLTPLAGLAFSFTIAGIVFGVNRLLGYSLIGIGIFLAVIDIFKKAKSGNRYRN